MPSIYPFKVRYDGADEILYIRPKLIRMGTAFSPISSVMDYGFAEYQILNRMSLIEKTKGEMKSMPVAGANLNIPDSGILAMAKKVLENSGDLLLTSSGCKDQVWKNIPERKAVMQVIRSIQEGKLGPLSDCDTWHKDLVVQPFEVRVPYLKPQLMDYVIRWHIDRSAIPSWNISVGDRVRLREVIGTYKFDWRRYPNPRKIRNVNYDIRSCSDCVITELARSQADGFLFAYQPLAKAEKILPSGQLPTYSDYGIVNDSYSPYGAISYLIQAEMMHGKGGGKYYDQEVDHIIDSNTSTDWSVHGAEVILKSGALSSRQTHNNESLIDYSLSQKPDGDSDGFPKSSLGNGLNGSVMDQIRELKELLDDGILTKDEFDAQKKKMLDRL